MGLAPATISFMVKHQHLSLSVLVMLLVLAIMLGYYLMVL